MAPQFNAVVLLLHGSHVAEPLRAVYVFGAHSTHVAEPLREANVPGSQAEQEVLLLSSAYCPGGQRSQLVLLGSAANEPGSHAVQLVALPPADQVPGAHAPHVVPLTNQPGEQSSGVQAKAPASDTSPQGHAEQFCSPVAFAYVFAAHVSQLDAPGAYATLPMPHGAQSVPLIANVPP